MAPNPPQNFRVKNYASETSVELQWDSELVIANNAPTVGYRIYLRTLSGEWQLFRNIGMKSSPGLQREINIDQLENGAAYALQIRSVNSHGESEPSATLSFNACSAPKAPVVPTFISSSTSEIAVLLKSVGNNGGCNI